MNAEETFCPNMDCPARGQVGKGNIKVHSWKEKRYKCQVCQKTFVETKGTIYYNLKHEPADVEKVLKLLANGCPRQAIVAAYEIDERTVKEWWDKAGDHCQQVHEHVVGQSRLDLKQVQADEIKAKIHSGVIWIAMAIMVSTRLWLGGAISPKRDKDLISALVAQIRAVALCCPLLLAVDGLSSYVGAFQQAFRSKVPRQGKKGRCRLHRWPHISIVQVVKQRSPGNRSITRRIVQGSAELIQSLIQGTQGQGGINTAYIERLNATFRQRLAPLVRRSRALARQPETLQAGMFILGCFYNFCTYHASLRISLDLPNGSRRWLQRTPAIAAGLTDHCWSVQELFLFKVPPPRWSPPKQRGRPSKLTLQLLQQWAT